MEAHELEERIARFPRWNYRFEFEGGVTTPIPDPTLENRHRQRRRYFFDALLGVAGGSLDGHRVLDLGCNAGYWSLAAIEAGADFVLGVDYRAAFIEQAELVFEAKGVDRNRYRFEQGNVLQHAFAERFDVVLCLGMMDQVAKPVELFELMSSVGAELIVIDTVISRARSSFFEVSRLNDPRNAVEYEMVLIPTREAVVELAGLFGFRAIPLAPEIGDWRGLQDYRSEQRLAFVCAKSAKLDGLPVAKRPTRTRALTSMLEAARARTGR